MKPQDLETCMEEVAVWRHPFQVHFTGGEPFLNFPLLLQGAALAAQCGIPTYVETSASWCMDETGAHARFAELRAAGLQAVLISCSPFHAERIPLERTLRAVSAAVEVFGLQRTWVHRAEWLDHLRALAGQGTLPLENFLATGGADAGRLLWDRCGLIGGGRAGMRLGRLARRSPPEGFQWETCRQELLHPTHAHFDLYGGIIPSFCGGLRLGDWHTFKAAVQGLAEGAIPPLASVLAAHGPYGLYQLAREQHGFQPLPDGYADKCHLCTDVRRMLAVAANFAELAPARFYDF